MDIFLTKTHGFATGGLYSLPEPCEARFIMDARALFDVFWTVEQKHCFFIFKDKEALSLTTMIKLRIAWTIFNITPIGFI